MAETPAVIPHFPPTPPPPVYAPLHTKPYSPQTHTPPEDTAFPRRISGGAIFLKTTVSMVSEEQGAAQNYQRIGSPAMVRICSPSDEVVQEVYADNFELNSSHPDERRSESAPGYKSRLSPWRSGRPSRPGRSQSRNTILQDRGPNISELPRRRAVSDNSQHSHLNPNESSRPQSAGYPITSSAQAQPSWIQSQEQHLQYHHHNVDRGLRNMISKMTINSVHSDGAEGDANHRMYGNDLQRPDSGASVSDSRGRTRSPQLSPNDAARAIYAHSRSPDMHRLSYVDLLNVSYPQPGPSPAEHLVNPQLRAAIGSNASLLSKRKTLEMYRANIRKTDDLNSHYHFAIFLVDAAREVQFEEDEESDAIAREKSPPPIQDDLLKEAKHILQRLADKSHAYAQYYLADGLASGLFNKGKEDWDHAFPLFLTASKHHHIEATYRTALCYEYGWGTRIDAAKAVQFYQAAASKNHPGAMLRLGRACLMGDMGLGKRYREGIRWMKRASEGADEQYNSAPYELGLLHESGFGDDIFKDEVYTAQLFTKSADLGHAEASFRMGEAYEHGLLSCPRDPALSIHFYNGAAQFGHPQAQMALCAWYLAGAPPVLEKDDDEAYQWAKRAAESGWAKAQYAVGYFTEVGIGCRRDPLEANMWYVRAAEQGDPKAIHRLAAIRAAAMGVDPVTAAAGKKEKLGSSNESGNNTSGDGERKRRFGIF